MSPTWVTDKETTYFSFSNVEETSLTRQAQKVSLGVKRKGSPSCNGCGQPTHSPLCWNPSWLKDATHVREGPKRGQVGKKEVR